MLWTLRRSHKASRHRLAAGAARLSVRLATVPSAVNSTKPLVSRTKRKRAELNQTRSSFAQPLTPPDHHVMSKRAEQHHHLLTLELLLRTLGHPKTLLVFFELGFYTTAASGHRTSHRQARPGADY